MLIKEATESKNKDLQELHDSQDISITSFDQNGLLEQKENLQETVLI